MRTEVASFLLSGMLLLAIPSQAKMTPEQVKQLPPAAPHKIDFTREIKPILEKSCANCHGHGRSKGKFRIDNRETFLKGGSSDSPVVLGKSEESLLIELVMGFDPDNVMPAKGSKLTSAQIALLRAWIDQGAVWDEGVWLGKVEAKNVKPRLPEVPVAKNLPNPVDAFIDRYFKTNKIKWPEVVNDRVFARRVYLDIIGLLPTAKELDKFLADKSRDKREKLVDSLLNQQRAYAEHWLTFWNDMLRNDYRGTGYIDGGRKQITKWLFKALEDNKPYDQFVAELVNPTSESEGFTKGIIWRGVVNASQTPEMQAAQTISQVFMGLNMKCASCHDSFINDWQLSDAYALANIYAKEQLELFECDKPTGKKAATKFLYPEFGEIDAAADKPTRLKQLADCITSEKNGRLSRTLVNRLWGRLLGRAFVEPVDDMEQAGWNQDLLDWLAEDFVAHKYDVKHLLKQIVMSRAYQLPAVNLEENVKDYVFRGPAVRRLTAEQFRDALMSLTGIGYSAPAVELDPSSKNQPKFESKVETKWIWNSKGAEAKAKAEYVYFRKTIEIPVAPASGLALVSCDNSFTMFVNGQKAGGGDDFTRPTVLNITPLLKKGANLIAIEAINNLPANVKPTSGAPHNPGDDNPAGLLFFARIAGNVNGSLTNLDFATDDSWLWSAEKTDGWEKPQFAAENWSKAFELGNIGMHPWRIGKEVLAKKLTEPRHGDVRAALVAADPLMVALGRPNREQVVTTRPSTATTLQALEMTNGGTLSDILKRGAEKLLSQNVKPSLIQEIYEQALGRKPTSAELKMAKELVGQPVQKEGVEDFLWAMTMLPEFQLIY